MYAQSAGTPRGQLVIEAMNKGRKGMDDDIKAYCRQQIEQLTAGNVYCDLILSAGEATALQELVTALRASGQHQVLDRVFNDILEEIERASELDGQQQPWP